MIAGFRNNHLIVKNGRWKSFPCACEFEGARRRGLMRSVALDPTDIRNRWVVSVSAENGGYPPTQNGDIRSLFWLFSLMALQN